MAKKEKNYTIGIDIGGTKMRAVLFDEDKTIADYTLATPKDSLDHFFIMIKALLEPLEEKAKENKVKIGSLGLGIAGVIDYKENRMLKSPNIPLINNLKLTEKLESLLGYPVIMDNDANCFVRAEAIFGAGRGYDNIYGITIGTGIGGGWWVNNEVYKGAYGGAGEPGEIIIDFKEKISLEKAYQKITQNNPAHVAEEAYRGDILAQKTYDEFGQMLGAVFANIVNLIDPQVIIIGGGVVESSDLFVSRTKKSMLEHILSTVSKKKIKIIKSKLGQDACAIGAAVLNY